MHNACRLSYGGRQQIKRWKAQNEIWAEADIGINDNNRKQHTFFLVDVFLIKQQIIK